MYYIAFYDIPEYSGEARSCTPSALPVVGYMADVFSGRGEVNIICPARTLNKKGFVHGHKKELRPGVTLRLPPSFGVRTPFGRTLVQMYTTLWLFFRLMAIGKSETVVAYHSLFTMLPLRLARRLRGFRLIGEVREIYSNVENQRSDPEGEAKFFFAADAYIFPTSGLNDIINVSGKPYVIATGDYSVHSDPDTPKFDDGYIHAVYAGTLDPAKGGAHAAICAAVYLPKYYHIHILGFGTDDEIRRVRNEAAAVNRRGGARVTYDGVLRGERFSDFLRRCDIGIAAQRDGAALNKSSFPSKILTYLSHGLYVVALDIPAVRGSGIGEYVSYYRGNDPAALAEAIVSLRPDGTDTDEVLSRLDRRLRADIRLLLTMKPRT